MKIRKVNGQGSGPRIDKKAGEEDQFDSMGNKIEVNKKKLTAAEAHKAKKGCIAGRKRGEEVDTHDKL